MADVKWIKITTDMFDNKKIKHLRRLPDGNNIVLIWVMLLTMAGRCNSNGMIFLTENIPYTAKMLADELDFEESTVQLAIKALEQLGMIQTNNEGFLSVTGWSEHQNIEGMDKIRQQNRVRKQRQRAKATLMEGCHVNSRDSHATDIDIDKDIDKEIDIKNKKKKEDISVSSSSQKQKKTPKHKHGEYSNVLLTDDELDKLKGEYQDWEERIERLSSYMASTGKVYKSHYATIRNWARKDADQAKQTIYRKQTKADELNDFYSMAADWAEGD